MEVTLPEQSKDPKWGKWTPTWYCPFVVTAKLPNRAYRRIEIEGQEFKTAINGQYLKKFYPLVWEENDKG